MRLTAALIFFVGYVYAVRDDSISYHKFSGPVSGEIREVLIPEPSQKNPNGRSRDFIAKPDYTYSYGVQDPVTGLSQDHQESRDGDAVQGQYSVLQADGTTRIVRYVADAQNGFKATVEYVPPGGKN